MKKLQHFLPAQAKPEHDSDQATATKLSYQDPDETLQVSTTKIKISWIGV